MTSSNSRNNPRPLSALHEVSPGGFIRAAQQAVRDAERRFPVRVRIGIPPEGLGDRLDQIIAWLDVRIPGEVARESAMMSPTIPI
jgi:hypothetical protein